jgi:hypothetical protein
MVLQFALLIWIEISRDYFDKKNLEDFKGAFDLLKNRLLDMTTFCTLFDVKTGYGTGQNRYQGTGQNQKFLSFTKPQDNFLSTVQL